MIPSGAANLHAPSGRSLFSSQGMAFKLENVDQHQQEIWIKWFRAQGRSQGQHYSLSGHGV